MINNIPVEVKKRITGQTILSYFDCERQKMMENKKRAILIGAGEKNAERDDLGNSEENVVIALDGGLIFCVENDIIPNYIIGDFDSLPCEKQSLLENYPNDRVMRLPCEKDDTDMLAAIKFAMKKGISDFVIYGGLGGRLSHTIANIQCLMYLKERGLNGVLVGKNTRAFLLKNETVIFDEGYSGYISVFSYSEKAEGVTLKGLKYELEDAELTAKYPLGVSNELIGKEAQVSVREGVLLLVMDQ